MTTENNKIIAEFMGCIIHIQTKAYLTTDGYFHDKDLKFHSDWNWLMEVVEKIYTTKASYNLHKNIEDAFIYKSENRIESVYNACVEFIKWYNNENK